MAPAEAVLHTAGMTMRHVEEIDVSVNERRWDAVATRDSSADGQFVYAVSSTGIFCKPSCASRRPRRDRVVFFDTPAAAVRAGYRACKRCRPDAVSSPDSWTDKVRRACVYLANVDGHVSLQSLAQRFGGSPYHFQRSFKRLVGVTPREYADACRLHKTKRGLRTGATVTDAIVDAGFASSSRFYERVASKLAMHPTSYRRGAAGATIAYAIDDSPLGRLLVAATEKGICAVFMADSDANLERALRDEFPAATLVAGHDGLKAWMRDIVRHLQGRRPTLKLPLDIQATAFQWQVWNALSRIPYGETRPYKEVAASIGRPSAVRAVAHACATNPVSVLIPCHRVVRTSGQLAGYRWGLERKRALLAAEHRMKNR